jgi:hypothetical protein
MDEGRPFAARDDEILVEYHQFGLQDERATDTFLSLGVPEDGVRVGPGVAALLSDGNDHYPSVRLESWPREPRQTQSPWDVEEGFDESITLPSGVVRLWAVTGGPSNNTFEVGPPGRYRLRINVRGYAAAIADGEIEPDETFAHGAERWLLRFWPAA